MKSFELRPFEEKYVEDAAKLFAENFQIEREKVSFLPERFEDYKTVVPLLRNYLKKVPGVIAIKNNRLVGYLIGSLLPNWRGRRSVYIPVWANSVREENRRRILEQMYTLLSLRWVANGCFTHLITVLAQDKEIIDALFWLGFGMAVIDAMQEIKEIQSPVADIEIRKATSDDLATIVSLCHEHQRYMAGPPIFMAMVEKRSREYYEKWLSNPSNTMWFGLYQGKVVAYMIIMPMTEEYLITDEKTAWIQGAFTQEHLRCKGIGTALLKQCLAWAKSQGYVRCAVDFEGENLLASRFWLKYFQPICFSLIRQIDQRIAWAHAERADEHFW
ncbi:MAG: GNAT family N-acetyltransferase [candidate division WOR-3 bacterium]|nr:GNAT family N-acetyltransferase [candidate division WOR-3 bacterium]